MTVLRMDHVVLVVEDLPAATAFFLELGLVVEGEMPVEGAWVDAVNGVEGVRVDIVMLRTPDGSGGLELTRFRSPQVLDGGVQPPHTTGLRSVMFAVDDVDDTVARLAGHGGELVGEVAQYEDAYRLCYVRGPAGVIVALAQPLS
ncbi:MAG: Glyoxalase/bleomycin resistance protein/dioxygenase [Frankiales bacterium]|nr:Glyoxalase/bleomycin resistance protein/dioxygenase [Frankiales bacterium]